ncbi:Solute carrier family 25 member 48 [Liparis tanakae]|uniref:Solute carrier family 25 member 48 n=1 Tax=Liparis tanakae TaxID=230148 RepID=A0A4Z2GCM2_9TELE|nr:Solute carrier family 25 member 48 [Liparis tanakae]
MQPTQSFRVDDFIAGCIGGSCSVVVGHPLDTVKAMGFFRGMSFPLASITIYNSVVFGFFSNAQRLISRYRHGDGRHPCGMADLAAASMLTGLMSVGLGAPVDLVKIRLQLQTQMVLAENLNLAGNVPSGSSIPLRSLGIPTAQSPYRGPLHCVSSILQTEGLPGLYRGAGAMVLRDSLGSRSLKVDPLSPPGSISWVTATPADVVKSRLQADAHPQRKYRGIVHCIVQSYKTEGAQVFFRGASVNAIRGFPMSATMFLTYELSLQFFRGL